MKRNMTITSLANSEAAERARRRGNTIVLVTGILVLLVIIATAYVTRTQAGRTTASAYLTTGQRENNRDVIVEQFAQEIAEALFVREAFTSNSNDYRAAILPDAVRYGVDRGTNFKFNFAPYSVVPWTNWPDDVFHGGPLTAAQEALWPKGAGNPNGGPTAEPVYRVGRLTASYVHFYFASNPVAAARLFLP